MQSDEEFIEQHRPFVRGIARRVAESFGIPSVSEDLIADGFRGLLEARENYDPERGVRFTSFAYYRVRGAVVDGVRQQTPLSRRAHARLRAAESALEIGEAALQSYSSGPRDAATAQEKLHQTVSQLTAGFVLSSVGQDENHETEGNAEEALIDAETRKQLRAHLDTLPERERTLIVGFYFEGRRFDDIAAELGVSKSWVSRLHTKALQRLRRAMS